MDPWGLYKSGDWQLTPTHVAEIMLYTMQYYGGIYIGNKYIAHSAENSAEWIRKNDPRTNEHKTLKRLMDYMDSLEIDYSNWGCFY